jgi:two-component system, chemotaxis family, sensor kinase CheA
VTEFTDQELINEFLVESYDNLDLLDRDFVALEQNPAGREMLHRIFRCIHTIKGTCGFLGFSRLESVAHAGENVLSRLRDGELSLTPGMTSGLLEMVDAVREILGNIERGGGEGDADYSDLVATLEALQAGAPTAPRKAAAATIEVASEESEPAEESAQDQTASRLGELLVQRGDATPNDIADALLKQLQGDTRAVGEILEDQGAATKEEVAEALAAQDAQRDAAPQQSSISDNTIRVDVQLLDKIMNAVGELVLSRNQIMPFATAQEDMNFMAACQRLNAVTTELQKDVVKTRVQPIGNIWNKFPRIVRDLSKSAGKKIRIEMEGEDTELDKTILEAIKDPLTHIVRNAVGHGLERPEERAAAGRGEEGVLKLRACHEGGQVIIEIADDGGGIDIERVRNKAVEKNIITAEQAKRMNRHEAVNLIFAAGLSTAEAVTNISGRGVGMDVVRANIEKIGGTIDVTSEPGAGTTLRVKIPLTMAVIPVLIVTIGEDRYAIPQTSPIELVRIEANEASRAIEYIQGSPVYRLRGRLLPLVHLGQQLGISNDAKAQDAPEALNIVVLQAAGHQFGLVVEQIDDTEEILVKPLSTPLKNLSAFTGATIMGNGKVVLVLDVRGIAQQASVITRTGENTAVKAHDPRSTTDRGRQPVLLFKTTGNDRMAMPLDLVDRLEEFPYESIQKAGALDVVRYRNNVMPLVEVGGRQNGNGEHQPIQVVVCSLDGKSVGLRVGQILDIAEEDLAVKSQSGRNGVLFTAVIQGEPTGFIDAAAVIQQSIPGFASGANERL